MSFKKKILRLPKVIDRVGYSRANIYLMISQGLFPAPITLGKRSVGWLEDEIDAWIEERIEATRSENGGQK